MVVANVGRDRFGAALMTNEQNKQVAAELFARFSASDIDGVLALMTDDVAWRNPGKPDLSPAAGAYNKERLRRLFNRMVAQVNDRLKRTVASSHAQGDRRHLSGQASVDGA